MNLDKIIGIIKNLNEEGMMASGGGLAGLPPDEPPVNLKKKKKKNDLPTIIGRGKFPGARKRWMK